jgi:SRSO17 transposase
MIENIEQTEQTDIFDSKRWGLPQEAIADLADRLRRIWSRFRECFTTKTRDTSEYAFTYMRGLLTMDIKRNYANIARRVISPENDGQNLQQFMSDSPWPARSVFRQIQAEICNHPELSGGMLTLDESGDKRSGNNSAGTARQHIGRLGKVDMGQVGVALGYYQRGIWAMVDAELHLPKEWFDEEHEALRRRWHIPVERSFATKIQLGLEMIRRAKANGMPFKIVGCDSLYGRDAEFRAALETEGILYMADIPANIHVYLSKPVMGIPPNTPGKSGRPCSRMQVINDCQSVEVRSLADVVTLTPVAIRHTERGLLVACALECAARRVWTITPKGVVRKEWLLVRREHDGSFSFSHSDAPEETSLAELAFWRCERYFAERTFQDAKTEAGWDELVARKYRAWMHHTAVASLDALALWFAAETKLDWSQQYPRAPELAHELEVAVLPALSMANIRELLKAVLPLKQLSPEEANQLVINHLVNRSRSTSCRLKAQSRAKHKNRDP